MQVMGLYCVLSPCQQFINAHGGSHNAMTTERNTRYYFDVAASDLEPALDRFSQFFIAPLFNADMTDREINAINSGELRAF